MKHSRTLIYVLLCFAFSLSTYAQIKVDENNCVGIAEDAPLSELSINDPGKAEAAAYIKNDYTSNYGRALQVYNHQSSSSWGYGLLASISNTSSSYADYQMAIKASAYASSNPGYNRAYGLFAVAGGATNGYNYGVYGQILGTKNGAAIFASTPGKYDINTNAIWAGYFRGDVFIEDDLKVDQTWYSSDNNLKKDIRQLASEEVSHISKLKNLNSIKYKLKTPADLLIEHPIANDTLSASIAETNFNVDKYQRDRLGISAQELQEEYPELVKEDDKGFLAVNYNGLIPVLLEATKEQQDVIEELQAELLRMKAEIDKLKLVPIKN